MKCPTPFLSTYVVAILLAVRIFDYNHSQVTGFMILFCLNNDCCYFSDTNTTVSPITPMLKREILISFTVIKFTTYIYNPVTVSYLLHPLNFSIFRIFNILRTLCFVSYVNFNFFLFLFFTVTLSITLLQE